MILNIRRSHQDAPARVKIEGRNKICFATDRIRNRKYTYISKVLYLLLSQTSENSKILQPLFNHKDDLKI